jgi:predicted ArsR family transcriptional regulator
MHGEQPADASSFGHDDFDTRVCGIAALGEPVRRSLYVYVAAQESSVNRDQAAQGVGVARHVAKFHLDKLVDDGLLEVEYRRPAGRGGPGAGRPTKFYRRSSREVAVSLPERHYELAGRLLARAIVDAESNRVPVRDSLRAAAREVGLDLGRRARERAGPRASRAAVGRANTEVLRDCGFEPREDATGVTLVNCPFHVLAQDYTELVCGMNLELIGGLVDGLESPTLEAQLDPGPGRCCVRLNRKPTSPDMKKSDEA